jgi:hypothetical protein
MKLADMKEKQLMNNYYKHRRESIKRDARLRPGNQIRIEREKKFNYERKISPEDDTEKKYNLWLKYVRWKQKQKKVVQQKLKFIEFIKGMYKFRIDTRNAEVIKWKEKWKKAKGRWKRRGRGKGLPNSVFGSGGLMCQIARSSLSPRSLETPVKSSAAELNPVQYSYPDTLL